MQHAQLQNGGSYGVRSRAAVKSNSLYTPTPCTASDREEEVSGSGEPDLSDYYSDSGYPTRPRPRHILWTSSSARLRTAVTEDGLQRKVLAVNGHNSPENGVCSQRTRRLSAPSLPVSSQQPQRTGETSSVKNRAFSKLRSLRNNRVLPVSSPDRPRPPSSLATTSLSANNRPKQLRSFSVPSGPAITPTTDAEEEEGNMSAGQGKLKKAKKVGRALSFSLGTSDKKRRGRSIFASLGRSSGTASDPRHSPVLVTKKLGGGEGAATIYEEDRASQSSTEEQEDRLGSLSYLHGNRFGSCRELTSVGIESGERLRPLCGTRHKRPSLPSFTKLPENHQGSDHTPKLRPFESESGRTSPGGVPTGHTPSPSTSPSVGRVLRRKLSDPGSAPSTPDHGNSPTAERRASREEVGVSRSNRPIRKGLTFSIGGKNLSPDWVCECVTVCV